MNLAAATYRDRLQQSFAALYSALEIPRIARRTVVFMLITHTFLLSYSAYVHSPTLNEPGHLVAGLSHWEFGRFEIYRVNPPLVKMVAALPVMAAGYKEDWSAFYEGPGARPEMGMGEDFVAANGERSFFLFMIARWACIPFSWLGAIICYLWGRDMYGKPSGVLAAAIWCFEPNILAHASLITPDAGATALGLAACYTFWRWLKRPTWSQAALTGVVLGLAELAKTTLILFYPLWPLMWLAYRWSDRHQMLATDWLREAGMLALRMAIGLYVLNLGYGFEGSFKPLGDFHFVSELFTGNESSSQLQASSIENPTPQNRFINTWLGELPVPFPKNYLLGIDLQQRDFEHYGRRSYLRGVWQDRGWWYYYLYACAIKVPLGIWALGFLVIAFHVLQIISGPYGNWRKQGQLRANSQEPTTSCRDEFILLFPAAVIFTVVSSQTGFSEHMRYVLPAFPFAFIWISQISQVYCPSPTNTQPKCLTFKLGASHIPSTLNRSLCPVHLISTGMVGLLGCWLVTSSLWIYPHSLSYFNESIGGPINGPNHLLGSNIDWGQDYLYLRDLISGICARDVSVAYFGSKPVELPPTRSESRLIPNGVPSEPSHRIASNSWTATPKYFKDGYLAISTSILKGNRIYAFDAHGQPLSTEVLSLECLRSDLVEAHAGYSIRLLSYTNKRM